MPDILELELLDLITVRMMDKGRMVLMLEMLLCRIGIVLIRPEKLEEKEKD